MKKTIRKKKISGPSSKTSKLRKRGTNLKPKNNKLYKLYETLSARPTEKKVIVVYKNLTYKIVCLVNKKNKSSRSDLHKKTQSKIDKIFKHAKNEVYSLRDEINNWNNDSNVIAILTALSEKQISKNNNIIYSKFEKQVGNKSINEVIKNYPKYFEKRPNISKYKKVNQFTMFGIEPPKKSKWYYVKETYN